MTRGSSIATRSDHCSVRNRGVTDQNLIDLDRVDVDAAGDDQLGGAPGQEEITVLVEPAHVAKRKPVATIGAVGLVGLFVVLEPPGRRRLGIDEPLGPRRDALAARIEQLDLDAWDGPANRAGLAQPFIGFDPDAAALGCGIVLV